MNLVYINSHDTGRFIQPYGHPVPAPRIQQFAEQGVIFRDCHCVNPTCSASRASMLTGTYAHQNGMFGLAHLGWRLNDYSKHISHHLKSQGYSTALYGIQHVGKTSDLAYDEYSGFAEDGKLSDWAHGNMTKPDGQPFYLELGFVETHRDFPALEGDETADYTMPPAEFPDTPRTRLDFARFVKMAADFDRKVGVVLDALERSGKADDTLVLLTTDHGIAFPRMKCTLRDGGTGVMLMLRGPGIKRRNISDALVSHIDVFPTLCQIMGIPSPDWLEGRSLCPLLDGSAEAVNDAVFSEVNWHGCWEPMRAVRTKRYKYIRHLGGRHLRPLVNCDAGLSKNVLLEAGWREEEIPREELFDLLLDPMEKINLADQHKHADTLDEMRQRMQAWRERTQDPLLSQTWVKPPEGAVICDPDDTDPAWDRNWVWKAPGS